MNIKNLQIAQAFSDRYRNKVRLLHLCDYLLFCLFCFAFLSGLQSDLISLTFMKVFHLPYLFVSGGIAFILTVLFVGIQIIFNRFLRLKGRCHAISFIPSFLLLTLFTNLVPEIRITAFIPIIAGICTFIVLIKISPRGFHTHDTFWTLLQPNLVCILVCFLFVTLFSNTNDIFHYELKTERKLIYGHNEAALQVGQESLESSHLLLSLRANALSKEKKLGEQLFEFPIPSGDSDLFFNQKELSRMICSKEQLIKKGIPESYQQFVQKIHSGTFSPKDSLESDYWLCTLLLEKKLDLFAQWLTKCYPINKVHTNLPKHYREALVLYNSLFIHPRIIYHSVSTEQNYEDFMELYNKYKNKVERNNFTRRLYGNTYWWYYYFHQ